MDFSNQFQQIQNSVVRVVSITGQDPNIQIVASGSGVLIGNGRKILTCSHCVVANTRTIAVLSGQTNGQVVTAIFNNAAADVAILEAQNFIAAGVTLGNSDLLRIGHEAFVAGYPSTGITITALFAHIAGFETRNGDRLIKIDSSVNHGNSGGPLFNANGELVGIVNSKFGNLSTFLTQVEQANPQVGMVIGGINPVQVIQQLIKEMKKNLNLGVGTAIPLQLIGNLTNHVGDLLPPQA